MSLFIYFSICETYCTLSYDNIVTYFCSVLEGDNVEKAEEFLTDYFKDETIEEIKQNRREAYFFTMLRLYDPSLDSRSVNFDKSAWAAIDACKDFMEKTPDTENTPGGKGTFYDEWKALQEEYKNDYKRPVFYWVGDDDYQQYSLLSGNVSPYAIYVFRRCDYDLHFVDLTSRWRMARIPPALTAM